MRTTSIDPVAQTRHRERREVLRWLSRASRLCDCATDCAHPHPRMRIDQYHMSAFKDACPLAHKGQNGTGPPAQSALVGRRAARSTWCSVVSASRNLPRLIQVDAAVAVAAMGGGIGIGIGIGGTS